MPKHHRRQLGPPKSAFEPRAFGQRPVLRIFLLAAAAVALTAGAATAHIRGDRWLEDVKYLASDALKGRGSGSPELTQAANYIADQFKKAYTARDADAAMGLFFWQSAKSQDWWWHSLNKLFATPLDAIEVLAPDPAKDPKTALPIVGRLRITTKKTPTSETTRDLLIGKNENGYYISPPLWDK